jgi:hypothetical protein
MNTTIYLKLTGYSFSSNLTAVKTYASDGVAAMELRPTVPRVKVSSKMTGDEKISSLKIKIIFMSKTFFSRLYSGYH